MRLLLKTKKNNNLKYKKFNKYNSFQNKSFKYKNLSTNISTFLIKNSLTYNYNFLKKHELISNKYFLFLSQTSLLFLKLFVSFFYKTNKLNHKIFSHKSHFILSFKRNRFFPNLTSQHGHTYCGLSLGSFLSFFVKPKAFKKSKPLYILLINFFRKIFLYSQTGNLVLIIKFVFF
jgi:hypothetical protein